MTTRERKELACADSEEGAKASLLNDHGQPFRENEHEMFFDPETKLFSIYYRRRKTDKTIKRPITRVARAPYSNGYGRDRRPVVVTLLPRELVETRLKGTRRRYTITWDDLHAYLVRRHALNVMRQKQAERAARGKMKREQRRQRR